MAVTFSSETFKSTSAKNSNFIIVLFPTDSSLNKNIQGSDYNRPMQNIRYAWPQSIAVSRAHAIIPNIKSQKSPIAAATTTRSGRG